jgi:hypothetical protein
LYVTLGSGRPESLKVCVQWASTSLMTPVSNCSMLWGWALSFEPRMRPCAPDVLATFGSPSVAVVRSSAIAEAT